MKIISKSNFALKDGDTIPKGAHGILIGVSNAPMIREAFPLLPQKDEGWFHIVIFNGKKFIVTASQVEFEK